MSAPVPAPGSRSMQRQLRLRLTCLLVPMAGFGIAVSYLVSASNCHAQSKNDRLAQPDGYKEYHNKRFGFSFQYPEQWGLSEALNGRGVRIASKERQHLSGIDVGGSVVQADQAGHAQSLEEEFEYGLASLRKWRPRASHHISMVVVTKKELTSLRGFPAIASTISYDIDSQNWVDKGIMFRVPDVSYTFGISFSCHPDELSVFQPVYDKILETFRFMGDGEEKTPTAPGDKSNSATGPSQ